MKRKVYKTKSRSASALRKLCRVFFSRYAISALLIVVEVVLMTYLLVSATTYFYVFLALAYVFGASTLVSLINKDANPEYKVTWAVIILIFPVFGPVIYLLFYNRRMTRGESRLLRGSFSEMNNYRLSDEAFSSLMEEDSLAGGKALSILREDALSEVYKNTSAEFFSTGESYFESLLVDLAAAKKYIFLEYFIIESGSLWDSIHEILREKAAAGVDVRLIYDDIGCMKTLPAHYEIGLRLEGISAHRFSKVSARVSAVHNNRDHRKICVIDGKIGYTGGVNIADEYVNRKLRFGHWKDGGLRLVGDAVRGLTKLFLSSWDFTTKTVSDYEAILSQTESAQISDGGYYIPFGSGPAPIYRRPVGKNVFMNIINQAEKYVYITTPYLIIDYDLTEALCGAAHRGVDVRIITPGVPDKKIVKIMTKSSYPHLMEAGVKIYEYTPGFIHEKTLVSDDKYAIVGTINFDYRSLVHHFENAVWTYKSPIVSAAKAEFLHTVSVSERIDVRKSRLSFTEWLLRMCIKLFAPLL